MSSDKAVIEVRDLTKWYPQVLAVDNVSFSVKQGQVVGFLGPNGAGKTTTLKMLTCFLPPTSGEAWVAGHSIAEDPAGVRRSIGYLPEHNALYEEMRVAEYLRFRATLKGVPWLLRRRYVDEAMEQCGLTEVRDRVIGHLSKGYRQRVGLADTLVHKPPVLILDEPTVGLDPAQIVEVRGLIKRLAQENTVLLSTHYLAEVEQICDWVVIIHQGRIVASDSLENLRRKPDGTQASLEEVFMRLTGSEAGEGGPAGAPKSREETSRSEGADEETSESKESSEGRNRDEEGEK